MGARKKLGGPAPDSKYYQEAADVMFNRVGPLVEELEALGYTDGMKARVTAAELATAKNYRGLAAHIDALMLQLSYLKEAKTLRRRVEDFFETDTGLVIRSVMWFVFWMTVAMIGLGAPIFR